MSRPAPSPFLVRGAGDLSAITGEGRGHRAASCRQSTQDGAQAQGHAFERLRAYLPTRARGARLSFQSLDRLQERRRQSARRALEGPALGRECPGERQVFVEPAPVVTDRARGDAVFGRDRFIRGEDGLEEHRGRELSPPVFLLLFYAHLLRPPNPSRSTAPAPRRL